MRRGAPGLWLAVDLVAVDMVEVPQRELPSTLLVKPCRLTNVAAAQFARFPEEVTPDGSGPAGRNSDTDYPSAATRPLTASQRTAPTHERITASGSCSRPVLTPDRLPLLADHPLLLLGRSRPCRSGGAKSRRRFWIDCAVRNHLSVYHGIDLTGPVGGSGESSRGSRALP